MKYDDETKRQAVQMHLAGLSHSEISEQVGCSLNSVKNWVRRYESDEPIFRNEPPVEQLAEKYEAGASLKDLTKEFGISKERARKKLIDAGISIRSTGRIRLKKSGGMTARDREIVRLWGGLDGKMPYSKIAETYGITRQDAREIVRLRKDGKMPYSKIAETYGITRQDAREIVRLRKDGKMPYSKIAETYGITRQHAHGIVRRCKEFLEKQ